MKVACYLRVSSESQTTDNQLADIWQWLNAHGVASENVTYYSENESAWQANHQRELGRLLSDLRTGKRRYDVLLCWALDRLSRQGIGAMLALINTLKAYSCRVISCRETWTEADSAMSEMFYAFIAWAAKFESDRRSERIKAGIARRVKEGYRPGRKPGAKDKSQRSRLGYYERYANKSKIASTEKYG